MTDMTGNIKRDFALKYQSVGADRFYRSLLSSAIFKMVAYLEQPEKMNKMPDIELLELYERFVIYYRREGNEEYLEIAKICRKAAHKVYRALLRQKLVEKNLKFLNLV